MTFVKVPGTSIEVSPLLVKQDVGRGGSWYYGAQYLRVADQGRYDPGGADYDLGFRLVRDL